MERIDRRQALRILTGATGALLLPSTANAQEIDPLTQKFIFAAKKIGVPDIAGLRIGNRFERGGKNFLPYSRLILTEDDDGSIVPWNTMDQVHDLKLDQKFKDGSVGVLVPEQSLPNILYTDDEFHKRLDVLQIPYYFRPYIDQIKETLDPGLPTSSVEFIQVKGERVLATLRFQSIAVQMWVKSGIFEPQLIGNAATQLEQLIPQAALLTKATDDPEINLPPPSILDNVNHGIDGLISLFASSGRISTGYASQIANCESRFNPRAQNPSGARGLWQIMPGHAPKFAKRGWNYWTDWMDPYKNTVVAIEILQTQGLGAWDCA